MKDVNVYVAASGNAFMTDIATWIVEAAQACGRAASLVTDRLPHDAATINLVVAPHEFFPLFGADRGEIGQSLPLSVVISTEQPGTPWFRLGTRFCRRAAAVYDINVNGVAALRDRGIDARRLALGGVPGMVAAPAERDLDVLFLGGDTPRRRAVLSTLGPVLSDRRAELRLFRFSEPVRGGVPGLVFGADKYALLARTRILVNVHRDDTSPGYFEWARIVEALANGTTVITEPSVGFLPMRPGSHFVVVATDDVAAAVAELLDDPDRCAAIGAAGATAVLDEQPLAGALQPILDRLDGIAPSRRQRARWTVGHRRPIAVPVAPLLPISRPLAVRRQLYHALAAEQLLQRQIESVRCQHRHGTPHHDVEQRSLSYDDLDAPEVTAVVTLYNYADLVTETLDSLADSRDVTLEIVVVDDHSTDGGRDVVQRFLERRPEVPLLLLGSETNRGLPASRNLGITRARADNVLIIDADNLVYPTCLRRLADALANDPGASFAYAMLEAFGEARGLHSHLAWHLPWLCEGNYLDAQALVRRQVLLRHGGYRDDDEWIYGWEDWDLWLRLAVAGERGVHVAQPLGRYRTQRSSMISTSNLVADTMRANLVARYPTLPWPESKTPTTAGAGERRRSAP